MKEDGKEITEVGEREKNTEKKEITGKENREGREKN